MRKRIKYVVVVIIGIPILIITTSDRKLKLGIVNAKAKVENVEIVIDGELYKTLKLEESTIPLEFVEANLSMRFHSVDVIAKDCDKRCSFEFFNLIGYYINVEYQDDENGECNALNRESHLSLTYN